MGKIIVAMDEAVWPMLETYGGVGVLQRLDFGTAVNLFEAEQKTKDPDIVAFARAALAELYQEGATEMEDDAIVSAAEDLSEAGGAYVMAWVWVPLSMLQDVDKPAIKARMLAYHQAKHPVEGDELEDLHTQLDDQLDG